MNVWIRIFVMAAVTFVIRVLPLTLIRKPIENQFINSFLYYVPYITLAVMTFPSIMNATEIPLAGILAFIAGILVVYKNGSLFMTASTCCIVVFVVELILV